MTRKELIKKLAGKYKKKILLAELPEEDVISLDDELICKDEEFDLGKVVIDE